MANSEMLRIEIKPGDVRRVNPRDKDAFMALHPGAKVLTGDATPIEGAVHLETEQANNNAAGAGKAVSGPPENKAKPAPSRSRSRTAAPEPPAEAEAPPETERPVEPPAEEPENK